MPSIRQSRSERPVRVETGAKGFSYYRHSYGETLLKLMAVVGLVLLVVCANVANLMLARAVARGREMSRRMALGAGRLRLVQQLVTESLLLALAGGAVGLLVSLWGSGAALLRLAGGGPTPIPLRVHMDGRILGFTALLSLVTAVAFGLVPALRATRVDLATALRTQGRETAGGYGRPGKPALAKLLVVGQVALSPLLPVGTGMLVRSMQRLDNADVGVERDRLVAQVVGFFGMVAMVLAALGLYGVMAHATLRRTTEFGLRMALGAVPGDVTRMVLRESMAMVARGVLLGVPAALAAMRLVQGRLYGIGVLDPPRSCLPSWCWP